MGNITINVNEKERRMRRLSTAIKPSTYEQMAKIAAVTKLSLNDLVNQALEQLVDSNQVLIKQYDEENESTL